MEIAVMKTSVIAATLALAGLLAPGVYADERERASGYATGSVEVKAPEDDAEDRHHGLRCVQETGTHIRRARGKGCERAGRSYSRDDLWRRGETDLREALIRMDPAFSGGRR